MNAKRMHTVSGSGQIPVILAFGLCAVLAVTTVVGFQKASLAKLELEEARAALTQATADSSAAKSRQTNNSGEVQMLRKLLEEKDTAYAELRKQLDGQPARSGASQPQAGIVVGSGTNSSMRVSIGGGDGRGWLERMRAEDPERAKQVEEAREKFRQQVAEQFRETMEKLDARIRAAKTQEEADLLTQMSQSMVKMSELQNAWQQIAQLPAEQRGDAFRQLAEDSRAIYEQLSALRSKDRDLQLQQLAVQSGYTDPQQAAQFVNAVKNIYKETDSGLSRLLSVGSGGRRGGGGQ
jgi:hypothetical protein